jgi:hypothetical protein
MLNENIVICDSIDELRHFVGGSSATHFSKRSLVKLKEEATTDLHMLHSATVDAGTTGDSKRKMQLNGPIAARNAIINKIDSLLKTKGL